MLPNLVDLFCISLWFILCGSPRASRNYISWYFLNLNAVHCSYTPLIPQIVWRGKPWLPFDQAQLTLNGSFRQMLISGKGSCTWWNNINREMSFGIFTFFTLSWPHYQPYPPIFFFFFFLVIRSWVVKFTLQLVGLSQPLWFILAPTPLTTQHLPGLLLLNTSTFRNFWYHCFPNFVLQTLQPMWKRCCGS